MLPLVFAALLLVQGLLAQGPSDFRSILSGHIICDTRTHKYMDVAQIEILDDGTWLAVYHVSDIKEAAVDQHVVFSRSHDSGHTWSDETEVESKNIYGPPSGRASTLRDEDGSVIIFYQYNYENVTQLNNVTKDNAFIGEEFYRVLSSNAGNLSERHQIPMEHKAIDARNEFSGEHLEGYGVGRAFQEGQRVFIQYAKRTNVPKNDTPVEIQDFFLSTMDFETWETLPSGPEGIQCAASLECHEGGIVSVGKDLYSVQRSASGFVGVATSKQQGHSFQDKQFAFYANVDRPKEPTNDRVKNSNSPVSIRSLGGNRYLMSFYNCNNGDRNPLWLAGGVGTGSTILWFQPEIVLYNPAHSPFAYSDIGSNPSGGFYITESTKTVMRVHFLPESFVESLFATVNQAYDVPAQYTDDMVDSGGNHGMELNGSFSLEFELSVTKNQLFTFYQTSNMLLNYFNGIITLTMTIKKVEYSRNTSVIPNEKFIFHLVVDQEVGIVLSYVDAVLQSQYQSDASQTTWFLADLGTFTNDEAFLVRGNGEVRSVSFFTRALRSAEIISRRHYSMDTHKHSPTLGIVLAVSILSVALLCVVVFLVWTYRRNKQRGLEQPLLSDGGYTQVL